MRALCRATISRKFRVCSGSARVVEQRFDIAADRRQRRAQLVRHVGDEIAAYLIRPLEVGDVVQDENRAAAAGRRDRRRARDEHAGTVAAERQLVGLDAAPRRAAVSCAEMSGWRITSR